MTAKKVNLTVSTELKDPNGSTMMAATMEWFDLPYPAAVGIQKGFKEGCIDKALQWGVEMSEGKEPDFTR